MDQSERVMGQADGGRVAGADTLLMVRPRHFRVNEETASDNAFQAQFDGSINDDAVAEFDRVVATLEDAGIEIIVIEGDDPQAPDCVFPNNWITTHRDGRIALYPMMAENRRRERRQDVVDLLSERFAVSGIVDYSGAEASEQFLEGTGSMVLDRRNKVAYAGLSERTDRVLFERFCDDFGYRAVTFETKDSAGRPIYHTNVMLALGTGYALCGFGLVSEGRRELAAALEEGGRTIIDLSPTQVANFAGNALELTGKNGPLLAMSQRGFGALDAGQRHTIERTATILPIPLETIEMGGGSLRCMLAEIYLPRA